VEKPIQIGAAFYGVEGFIRRGDKKLIDKRKYAVFQCGCTKRFVCQIKYINSGNTKSCGCHNDRARAERGRAQLTTHGMTRTREFRSWEGMQQRCYNKNATGYERWGGAGVTVCDRWRESFQNFLNDMGPRPEGTSLDRIDPFGNYEPSNCRWADRSTQNRNIRKNKKHETEMVSNGC
jgi:hypothetical protein